MKMAKFVLIAGLLALSLVTPQASAHTVLTSADPAVDSTIVDLPSAISLNFADELVAIGNSNSISAIDETGKELTSGEPEISGAVLSIKLADSEVTGVIKVVYRAVAADGHVITGDYQFRISPIVTSETATRTAEESVPLTQSENQISIYIIISAAIVVGGGLSLFFIRKRRPK
jgi:methionine-rich copper-binding protein CopC